MRGGVRHTLATAAVGLSVLGVAAAATAPAPKVVATVGLGKPLTGADTATLRLVSKVPLSGVRIVTRGGAKRLVTVRLRAGTPRTLNVSTLLRHPKVKGLQIIARPGLVLSGKSRPRLAVTRVPVGQQPPTQPPGPGDTTPPSGVGAVNAASTRTDLTLSWSPSTDNVGVTGYRVDIAGLPSVVAGGPSYTATGLECGRPYQVTVAARDAAGNLGTATTITATMAACPVIAAVGDIACPAGQLVTAVGCRHSFVANTIRAINPDVFVMLGDAQYDSSSASLLSGSYIPAFNDLLPRTRAVQGNHDFDVELGTNANASANGYFNYFGAAAGGSFGGSYYSFDIGTWHMVVLNSNCSVGSTQVPACATQLAWLQSDLAATRQPCIGAAWHHPRWSSFPSSVGNPYADNPALGPWVQALYNKGADLVLSGHAHHYERIGPVNPSEQLDTARGLNFWVVGTGGRDLRQPTAPRASSVVRQAGTFGPLKLTLGARSYSWEFVTESGAAFTDTGSATCRAKA